MNEALSADAESLPLLWVLAAIVAALAGHVGLGWVRAARNEILPRRRWIAALVASTALGTGLCAATVLAMSGEALSFPLGYRAISAVGLWLGAIAFCVPVLGWLGHSPGRIAVVGASLLLAGGATALQIGWFTAAGFRPGLQWKSLFVAAAAVGAIIGFHIALWLNFPHSRLVPRRRTLPQAGAALALAITLVATQQLLTMGSRMTAQKGSVYVYELPASILTLVCGALVPLVLMAMALELATRRRPRHRHRHRSSSAGQAAPAAPPPGPGPRSPGS